MLAAEDRTNNTDPDEGIDSLAVQEMKELRIFEVQKMRQTNEHTSSCSITDIE